MGGGERGYVEGRIRRPAYLITGRLHGDPVPRARIVLAFDADEYEDSLEFTAAQARALAADLLALADRVEGRVS